MKIGIIGAGFTGLAAAYELQKAGIDVTIIEKDNAPGGLAIGYQAKNWDWTLEKHYHHWFTSDNFVLDLAKDIDHKVIIKRPKTSVFLKNRLYELDSPKAILAFPLLPLVDKIRMSFVLAFLKFDPFWKPLEKLNAIKILTKTMGKKAFSMLWEPQLRNKMGKYADEISLVWFWTRINKRTPSLAYPEGGFLSFAKHLSEVIEKNKGTILYSTETIAIKDDEKVTVTIKTGEKKKDLTFDRVIVTLPTYLFLNLTPQLPQSYRDKMVRLRGLGATNMVLRLKKQFMPDTTYWLSICEKNSPVMVVVEHTNLMDKTHYNNEHLIYIGNYPESTSKEFSMAKEDLLKKYDEVLLKINPDYKTSLIDYDIFRAPFAQPIVPTNYSRLIPPFTTPLKHVFLANIEQVYPWDRGTNYAVELGQKIASLVSA